MNSYLRAHEILASNAQSDESITNKKGFLAEALLFAVSQNRYQSSFMVPFSARLMCQEKALSSRCGVWPPRLALASSK